MEKIIYAAVRRDSFDNHEFIDMMTVSESYDIAIQKKNESCKASPNWDHANPVRGINRFKLVKF